MTKQSTFFLLLMLLFCVLASAQDINSIKAITLDEAKPKFKQFYGKNKSMTKSEFIKYSNKNLSKGIVMDHLGNMKIVNDQGVTLANYNIKERDLFRPSYLKWDNTNSKLLGILYDQEKKGSLYLFNLDGTFEEIVAAGNNEMISHPDWSFNDDYILYERVKNYGREVELYAQKYPAGEEIFIAGGLISNPSWFNTNNKILYKRIINNGISRKPERELWVFDLATRKNKKIFEGTIYTTFPKTDPKDSLIALDTGNKVIIINQDGKLIKTFSISGFEFSWSPNGKYLSYFSAKEDEVFDRTLYQHIYVLDILKGVSRNITPINGLIVVAYKWLDENTIVY